MPRGIAKKPKEKSRKISFALKGKKLSEEHKEKLSKAKIGRKPTIKQLENLKLGRYKGKKREIGWKLSEETKRKMGMSKRGKKLSKEHIERLKLSHIGKNCGEKNHSWKGGITPLRTRLWYSYKYRQWRSDVFTRDDFTCQFCGIRGSKLEAHHIKQLALIIKENKIKTYEEALNCEEIWNINNGQTLCEKCHNLTKKGR